MNKNYKYIKVDGQDYILNIILDRPQKKNALHPIMIREIQNVFELYENKSQYRVILLSSNSDVFCSGADIKYLEKMKDYSYDDNLADSRQLMNLFKTMLSYPKLIVSKVSGPAIAGGCGIITASDIVFATNNSTFGYPEVKIGFIPALVSTFLMRKIKGLDVRELLLTGNIINAKRAKEIGLINYIYNSKEIDVEVDHFIEKFTRITSPHSIEKTKKLLYLSLDLH